jgi:hypothetical protein
MTGSVASFDVQLHIRESITTIARAACGIRENEEGALASFESREWPKGQAQNRARPSPALCNTARSHL